MKKTIKTILILLFLTLYVFVQTTPVVLAEETTVPSEQSTTTEQLAEQISQEEEQSQQAQQSSVDQQETTETQTTSSETNELTSTLLEPTPTPTPYVEDEIDRAARLYREQLQREIQQQVDEYLISHGITPPPRDVEPTPTESATTTRADGPSSGVGDVEIETGDATSATQVTNTGNTNLAGSAVAESDDSTLESAQIINAMNGTGSSNGSSATINNTDTTSQTNSASVNTNLNSSTVTGDNSASDNVGDTSITTGDANTSGTVLTMVNTNAQGVMVSEFNVVDDHVGDIVLDFAANCVLGCAGSPSVVNTGNASGSINTGSLDTTHTTTTFQDNEAVVGNDLVLTADSGNNTASSNTGGDTEITTGDANVAANVVTFANNNIAGNVIYGIVNIFGDLIGDIIFPEDQLHTCCAGSIVATNTGNGSLSANTSDVEIVNTDTTFQANTADIENNIIFEADTGNNSTSRNTGGDANITTGDTSIDANLLNIANANLIGGNWWIVLVNEAGNWVGKILGAPENAFFAGSEGSEFDIDENGFITVTNSKNGSMSTNTGSVTQTTNNDTYQTNNAQIENNLYLSANTGGNSANDNTGGNSDITTGDASIIANLVNFVNNNIVGNGKVFVTVVNVFGSWLGDFVSPGQTKEEKTEQIEQIAQNTSDSQSSSIGDTKMLGGVQFSTTSNSSLSDPTPTLQTISSPQTNESIDTTGGLQNGASVTGVSTNSSSSKNTVTPRVLGAKYSRDTVHNKDKKVIHLNLAWLLLAAPFIGLVFLEKKKLIVG